MRYDSTDCKKHKTCMTNIGFQSSGEKNERFRTTTRGTNCLTFTRTPRIIWWICPTGEGCLRAHIGDHRRACIGRTAFRQISPWKLTQSIQKPLAVPSHQFLRQSHLLLVSSSFYRSSFYLFFLVSFFFNKNVFFNEFCNQLYHA